MIDDYSLIIGLSIGVWVGTWASSKFYEGRTYTDGFFIGMIAAVITAAMAVGVKLIFNL